MTKIIALVAVFVAAAIFAPNGDAAKAWGGSCTISPSSPGFFTFSATGIVTSPGHNLLFVFSGPAATNPTAITTNQSLGTTQTYALGYTTPGTYTVSQVWSVNDKTGNGGGDGSGDQYTLLATNACSGSVP